MLNLNRYFTCPVCLEILKDPVLLPCSHNLCFECANNQIAVNALRERQVTDKQTKLFICPVCREGGFVDTQNANGLPRNILLRNIIDDYYPIQSSDELCQLCPQSPCAAQLECIACELLACQSCGETHLHKPRFAHHKMLPLKNTRPLICVEHQKTLDLFCVSCYLLCCITCAQFTTRHIGHKVLTKEAALVELADVIYVEKSQFPDIKQRLRMLSREVGMKIENVDSYEQETLGNVEAVYQELQDSISQAQGNARQMVQEKYAQMRGDIENKLETIKLINLQIEKLERMEDDLLFLQKSHEISDINTRIDEVPQSVVRVRGRNLQQIKSMINQLVSIDLPNNQTTGESLYYMNRGTKDFQYYNFDTDTGGSRCVRGDQMFTRWSAFTLLPNGNILVTGGKESKQTGAKTAAFILNPNTGDVPMSFDMIFGHSSHVSVLANGKVYICSGKNEANTTHSNCEFFDISTASFQQIANMNFGRTCAAGVQHGSCIYVIGGYRINVCNSIELYDIAQNTWTTAQTILPECL